MKILVGERRDLLSPIQSLFHTEKGAVVIYVHAYDELEEHLRSYDYDLLLSSYGFYHQTNFISTIRATEKKIPIMVVSLINKIHLSAVVTLLDAGCDEFLNHGFSLEELWARIRALVRRYRGAEQSTIFVDNFAIDLKEHCVVIDGKTLQLTHKEQELMECLALNKGRILSKEALLDHLYGGIDEPEIRIIDAFIWRLRHKIDDAGGDGDLIQTIWGRGYRFTGTDN